MAKDPAVLLYIANWLTATAGMDADARGWYLNLILHNYDKGGLPNDEEILAQLAGVKFSEYARFKHVLEHVLKQKFSINEESGLLCNKKAEEILRSREDFKDKRQRSGNIGVVIKTAKTIPGFIKKHIESLKNDLYLMSDEEIESAKAEQVLKHLLKLYININTDINIDSNKDEVYVKKAQLSFSNTSCVFITNEFKKSWLEILKTAKWKNKEQSAIDKSLKQLMKYEEPFSLALVDTAIAGGYQGVTFGVNTDKNYQEYLKLKNGTANSRDSAIESRNRMVDLATAILTGNQS